MSELKAGVIITPHDEGMSFDRGSDAIAVTERETEFYLKYEADKVIAELNEQIEVLKHQACKMDCMTVKLYNEACDDLIHQKYKRCLDKAEILEHIVPMTTRKAKWRDKWHKRWMELANKFKEAK